MTYNRANAIASHFVCLIVCVFYQRKIILHLIMEDIDAGSGKLKADT